jgi:hypothetical protein
VLARVEDMKARKYELEAKLDQLRHRKEARIKVKDELVT